MYKVQYKLFTGGTNGVNQITFSARRITIQLQTCSLSLSFTLHNSHLHKRHSVTSLLSLSPLQSFNFHLRDKCAFLPLSLHVFKNKASPYSGHTHPSPSFSLFFLSPSKLYVFSFSLSVCILLSFLHHHHCVLTVELILLSSYFYM